MYKAVLLSDWPQAGSEYAEEIARDRRFSFETAIWRGEEAAFQLSCRGVDLLILDLRERAESALGLMRRLRVQNVGAEIILVLSAGGRDMLCEAIRLGALDVFAAQLSSARVRQGLEKFVLHARILNMSARLNQDAVDALMRSDFSQAGALPKGLQQRTLNAVRQVFESSGGKSLSCEMMAEAVGLSRITVQRYLTYLVDRGEIEQYVNYHTGGRPCALYRRWTGGLPSNRL